MRFHTTAPVSTKLDMIVKDLPAKVLDIRNPNFLSLSIPENFQILQKVLFFFRLPLENNCSCLLRFLSFSERS
jgi:hypothetical protein